MTRPGKNKKGIPGSSYATVTFIPESSQRRVQPFCQRLANPIDRLVPLRFDELNELYMKTQSDLLKDEGPLPPGTPCPKFRSEKLVAAANEALCAFDSQGHFLMAGGGANDLFGYHPDRLRGKSLLSFVAPPDKDPTAASLQALQTGEAIPFFKHRFLRADGQAVPLVWSVRWDAADQVFYGSAKGAERKEVDEIIESQHRMMVEVLEQMQDGFATLSLSGKVIYWNREAELISGIERQAVLGVPLTDLLTDLRQAPLYTAYRRLLQTSEPVSEIAFSSRMNKWLKLHAYRTRKGVSIFFRDHTAIRQREEERQRLSLLARETVNAVTLVEADGRIAWVNEAFNRMFGYEPQEAIGQKNSQLLYGPETDRNVGQQLIDCFYSRQLFRDEIQVYTKTKEKKWVETYGQPLLNANGTIEHFFIMHTDISARKTLEQQLERQRKETTAAVIAAQEAERAAVGRELHDNVNQLLTSVKLFQELILDGRGNQDDLVRRSITLLLTAINENRCLSKRLSAPTLGNVKLEESIQELVNTVRSTNRFEVSLDTASIEGLEADQEVHLAAYRILQEQLTNILKYAHASRVEIRLWVEDKNLLLAVSDNGIGFDTTQRRTGIGITNMTTRAESLHGSFRLRSAPGQGCKLSVSLPLK